MLEGVARAGGSFNVSCHFQYCCFSFRCFLCASLQIDSITVTISSRSLAEMPSSILAIRLACAVRPVLVAVTSSSTPRWKIFDNWDRRSGMPR